MSVGHVARAMEALGIPTVIIAVKAFYPRLEPMRVPRLILTPNPLGRPVGAPFASDAQRHTLKAALDLLANAEGPEAVIELNNSYYFPF